MVTSRPLKPAHAMLRSRVEMLVSRLCGPSDRSSGGPASQATARPATVSSASPRWIRRVHQESSLRTVRPPRIAAATTSTVLAAVARMAGFDARRCRQASTSEATTNSPTAVAARRWVNSSQMW